MKLSAIILSIVLFGSISILSVNAWASAESPCIIWEASDTHQILFTSNDIVAFDWEKQIFMLNLDANINFLGWTDSEAGLAASILMKDNNGVIYEAQWVSPICSWSLEGPIYNSLSPNPFLSIKSVYPAGYKSPDGDNDLRFNDRLKNCLEKSNLLRTIDPNKDFADEYIRIQSGSWMKYGEDISIYIKCFENTFQPGRQARANIIFSCSSNPKNRIDAIEMTVQQTSLHTGRKSDAATFSIPLEDGRRWVYYSRFDPFLQNQDSRMVLMQGDYLIHFSFRFQQKKGDVLSTLYTADYPDLKITVPADQVSNIDPGVWMNMKK